MSTLGDKPRTRQSESENGKRQKPQAQVRPYEDFPLTSATIGFSYFSSHIPKERNFFSEIVSDVNPIIHV